MIFVALIGLTLLIVRGTIFGPLQRLWPALFRCAQCTGMWIGAAASFGGLASLTSHRVLDAVLVGAIISFLSMVADALLLMLLGDPHPPAEGKK